MSDRPKPPIQQREARKGAAFDSWRPSRGPQAKGAGSKSARPSRTRGPSRQCRQVARDGRGGRGVPVLQGKLSGRRGRADPFGLVAVSNVGGGRGKEITRRLGIVGLDDGLEFDD